MDSHFIKKFILLQKNSTVVFSTADPIMQWFFRFIIQTQMDVPDPTDQIVCNDSSGFPAAARIRKRELKSQTRFRNLYASLVYILLLWESPKKMKLPLD
jgi:hypothetical protein